jgi:thioredoxin 1
LAAAVVLGSCTLEAAPWKLVLKNGKTVMCEAPPVVINGVYLYRDAGGKDGSVPADQIDPEKTAQANKVYAHSQWHEVGRSAAPRPRQLHAATPPVAVRGNVLALRDTNFDDEVLNSDVPVLVDFWATWCGPCRRVVPSVYAIAGEYDGRVKVGMLDIDESAATARRYGIEATPTLILFKEGRMVDQIVGAAGKATIAEMVRAHL